MPMMEVTPEKRNLARALWEEVFAEDSEEFLDAYEEIRADNRIVGFFEGEELTSMIQANPFRIRHGESREALVHYLVGVATLPEYRHRGQMKALLHRLLSDSLEAGEPFAFLMPANEAIYLPFDFVTVTRQEIFEGNAALAGRLWGAEAPWAFGREEEIPLCFFPVSTREWLPKKLPEALNRILAERYDVFSLRDEVYLRKMAREMESEEGRCMGIWPLGGDPLTEEPVGFLAAWPGSCSMRDFALDLEEESPCPDCHLRLTPHCPFRHCELRELVAGEEIRKTLAPFLTKAEDAAKIMVRLLSPEAFLAPVRGEAQSILLGLSDSFLRENTGLYLWQVTPFGSEIKRISTEDPKEILLHFRPEERACAGNSTVFVENVENFVDICPEGMRFPGVLGGQTGVKVDRLWITDPAGLVSWRFRAGEETEGPKGLLAAGRLFFNEVV